MLSGTAAVAPWCRSLTWPKMLPWGADAVRPGPDLGRTAGWSCATCHEVAWGCGLGCGWTAAASCSVRGAISDAVEVALGPGVKPSWLKWSLVSSAPNVTLLFRRTFGTRLSQLLRIRLESITCWLMPCAKQHLLACNLARRLATCKLPQAAENLQKGHSQEGPGERMPQRVPGLSISQKTLLQSCIFE